MKVKIGNKTYDAKDDRIMIILTDKDKENIRNMAPECMRYAAWPDGLYTQEEMENWMQPPIAASYNEPNLLI